MSDNSSDEIIFCLSDIWKIFLKHKIKILRVSLYISLIFMVFTLSRPAKYKTKSFFVEVKDQAENASIKDLIISASGKAGGSQGAAFMLSSKVLSPLVREMGLQASINQGKRGILSSFFINAYENLLSERKKQLKDIDNFEFRDVHYEDELPLSIYIKFSSDEKFSILNKKKKKVEEGTVNFPCSYSNKALFTITHTPNNLKINKIYNLVFSSRDSVIYSLSKGIEIKNSTENKNILNLSIEMRNRYLSASILNNLMSHYQKYLKNENEDFAKSQLAYLEDRQDELNLKFKNHLDEYVSYLSENLGEKGFMTIDHELNSLAAPHSQYLSNMFAIDLEVNRLNNIDEKNQTVVDDSFSGKELGKISNNIADLQQEKDSINLSLLVPGEKYSKYACQTKVLELDKKIKDIDLELSKLNKDEVSLEECLSGRYGEELTELGRKRKEYIDTKIELTSLYDTTSNMQWVIKKNEELEVIRQEKKQSEELIKSIDNGSFSKLENVSYLKHLIGDNDNYFSILISSEGKRRDLSEHMRNHMHLLNVKENMIKQSYQPTNDSDFNGLDMDTAKNIYVSYTTTLDNINLQVEELSHAKNKLNEEECEISSLGLFLKDPASLTSIDKAGKLSIEINDIKNRGEKNIQRLKQDLILQKKFLLHHIGELIQLKKINKKLVIEKLESLKAILLSGINQKISLLNERAENFVKVRIDNLNREKLLLKEKTLDLQDKMESLPQRWKLEKLLQLKSDMSIKMMQATTQLLESKTISHHLHNIQSKPLDMAVAPILPESPRLMFMFLLSSIIAFICSYFFFFIKSAVNGFQTSLASLGASNEQIGGVLSSVCDGDTEEFFHKDLETLREITTQIEGNKGAKVISLLCNKGPNYSFSLAKLLGKREKKVLLIDSDFSAYRSADDKDGFVKYLRKGTGDIPIEKLSSYDVMQAGEYSKFSTEIISSVSFSTLLEKLSKEYDYILIYSSVSIKYSLAKSLLNVSNMSVITIGEESMRDMKPYMDWRDDSNCRYLSFIAIS